MKSTNQRMVILKQLLDGQAVTPTSALHDVSSFRLAAHIYVLRKKGYDIITTMVPQPGEAGQHEYASYTLPNFTPADELKRIRNDRV
tara:strand:- start:2975 stop:3235 length:261 start_codon:yes stop_codon:yes gene_type:complete